MKKIITFCALLVLTFNAISPITVAKANSEGLQELTNTAIPIENYDKYIKVENNKFVIDIPSSVNISEDDFYNVQSQIDQTNSIIEENGLVLDPTSKTAVYYDSKFRSAGVNKVEFSWNNARIYLSKDTVNTILAGGVPALGGVLGVLTGTGITAAAIIGFVSGIIGEYRVENGIWFDYNYFIGVLVGNWGWQ